MMEKLGAIESKEVKKYTCVFSDSQHKHGAIKQISKGKRLPTNKRKERRKIRHQKRSDITIEANKKHIKNLSNKEHTNDRINLLAKGLKFIPTPVTKQTQIRQQLLRDFDQFARRMRLMYIVRGENKEPHPYHVKSTWKPPIQQSVALESYLEEVKSDLAGLEITKPKNNLTPAKREALKALKLDTEINLKKADKGTTTVVMNTQDKIKEGQTLLGNKDNYRPLASPMVTETNHEVKKLINDFYNGDHIDDMTKKWLCQTPNPPRILEFYTLTKIHKPNPVGRPIVSGCDGPTEIVIICRQTPSAYSTTTKVVS